MNSEFLNSVQTSAKLCHNLLKSCHDKASTQYSTTSISQNRTTIFTIAPRFCFQQLPCILPKNRATIYKIVSRVHLQQNQFRGKFNKIKLNSIDFKPTLVGPIVLASDIGVRSSQDFSFDSTIYQENTRFWLTFFFSIYP